jgi:hypothetical protein
VTPAPGDRAGFRFISVLEAREILGDSYKMRKERINVFYYPEMSAAFPTLKKAILLFDEIHFMDRPAFTFGGGAYGLIGAPSPMRRVEDSFREDGVPLFVHSAPAGPVEGEFLQEINADIDDLEFLRRFQAGLKKSKLFRMLHIAPGNYGQWGNEENVYKLVAGVDLERDLDGRTPSDLFSDKTIHAFDLSTPAGRAKNLIANAAGCSAKFNLALNTATHRDFIPLADATPYGDLLGAKYARAVAKLEPAENRIQVTDLSFAIFDELIPTERLEKLGLPEVVRYRKESEKAREAFLEYLVFLQAKQAEIGIDGDYSGTIENLMTTEVIPAARKFGNDLTTIGDSLFGTLLKGGAGMLGGSGAFQLFGELSWIKLLGLAAGVAIYVTKAGIDGILADRKARRDCSISYILSLEP